MTSEKSLASSKRVRGWLLDLYPKTSGQMVLWIASESGERIKLVDRYFPKIYVAGEDLSKLTTQLVSSQSVLRWRYVERCVELGDWERKRVLEVELWNSEKAKLFAQRVLRFGGYRRYRVYNVDVPTTQAYFYEKEIFPLAYLEAEERGGELCFRLLDSVEEVEYDIPPLRRAWIWVEQKRRGKIPSLKDPLERIVARFGEEEVVFEEEDEAETILAFVKEFRGFDPDVVLTRGGDSFLLPYLVRRAKVSGVWPQLVLDRENKPLRAEPSKGSSFFSYGRVFYRAPSKRLFGRIHIDAENSFIYSSCGLEGLVEVSRTCRIPLHRAARAAIGTIMSSLQLYQAHRDGVLIPWKKSQPESFKPAWELLVADRGGLVFEPKVGAHDGVVELDFASMYPTLMAKHNISPETVLCTCCPNSANRVPELGYHICQKRVGLVPRILRLILEKRRAYKQMKREAADAEQRKVFERRQSALKWVLVTCFGYLGYRNARFGRVEAHIAVCAYAREALLRAANVAEEMGYEVVHGIVDSLWVKKADTSPAHHAQLCQRISSEVGVPISVEGSYRWVVFLPSKMRKGVSVPNRYYGVFEGGRIKARGIEARRRDTPIYVKRAQVDMIKELSKAASAKELVKRVPQALKVLRRYAEKLLSGGVPIEELVIAKRLSLYPSDYAHQVHQAIAAKQLAREGVNVAPGQVIRFVITNASSRRAYERVRAAELVESGTRYDIAKYFVLLVSAAETILLPFGYTANVLRSEALSEGRQLKLHQLS